ncbi:MAG: sodium:proline symporter [Verrucomicrobia bacterium]|nr:MAG: sodium:proline symporter [Verrucomicrobiota bacterium]
MQMQGIDWLMVLLPLVLVVWLTLRTRRYTRSVADFMAANRCANRYLLCTAQGESSYGLISAVAGFEMIYVAGFTILWWQKLTVASSLLLALSGYVIYRYRQTRAMTMAQFLEQRYSRNFRVFAGLVAFTSGVVNFGIFPAVGARFFVYFCGLPETVTLADWAVPTFALLMLLFVGIALALTIAGGQITILIATFLEGLVSGVFYLVVSVALLMVFRWDQIIGALANQPPGRSLLNPFDALQLRDFNIWYVLLGIFTSLYAYGSWQGGHAFKSSAASPHEAKMANILGNWRTYARSLMFTLLAVCAYTFMHHADFAAGAQVVGVQLHGIANPAIQKQMTVPVALAHLLPVGVRGILAAILLFAMLACDGSYMHSWGSIFVQDVILPLRKKALEPAAHLRLLRWAIAGVALFAFFFSLFFKQTDYILMFFAITGAIYSGAGAVIVGGLYWRKGTTPAAWVSMITGSTLAVTGLVIRQLHPDFPINGVWMQFMAQLCAIATYIVISLLTCRRDYDLDLLLHRGAYAVEANTSTAAPEQKKITWGRLAGFDAEFTHGDKWIAGGLFAWTLFWLGVFFVGLAWNFMQPWPLAWWAGYWRVVGVFAPLLIGIFTTIWFTIGGLRDLRRFFIKLATVQRDTRDDGRVNSAKIS